MTNTRIPPSMTTQVAPAPGATTTDRLRTLTRVFGSGEVAFDVHTLDAQGKGRVVLGRDPGDGGIALDDGRTSRQHAEVRFDKKSGGFVLADLGSRNGTALDGRPLTGAMPLAHGAVFRLGDSIFVFSDVLVPAGLAAPEPTYGLSPLRAVAEAAADLAAPTTLPILIMGPTGAGKELMASRVHERSQRSGPLVAVNCATFGRDLIGSELFGHKAGAFSGAKTARGGLFVGANGGTLFLDEIAELPLEQQPALLRALQEGKVRPVGADHEVEVDVRVVAATHGRLEALVDAGQFRADLFARLAGFIVDLPGLKDRRDEILPLFVRFLASDLPIATETAEALLLYDWPQNVRELKHAAERARLFIPNLERLELTALPPAVLRDLSVHDSVSGAVIPAAVVEALADDDPGRDALAALLAEHGGNVAQISRATGKHRQQIYRWLKKHGLDVGDFRDG